MADDFYKTLGVARNADEKDIKRAYRKLAKQYHPDANPDNPQAEAKFKEINQAYEVLGDSEKRAQYDQFGSNFANFQGFGGQNGGAGRGYQQRTSSDFGEYSDIFNTIFGGMGGTGPASGNRGARSRANPMGMKGQDIEHEVIITLREAYDGATRVVTKGNRRIPVRIPPGADTGSRVAVKGEGEPGFNGSQPGDLYLIINVEEDAKFERQGDNLTTEIKVDLFTALLGGEMKVPTMSRPVKLKVPAGTQSGQKFRLTGKGMPKRDKDDEFGNLYARVLITVPEELNDHQRDLVEQLKNSM